MTEASEGPVTILIAEDDEGHARLVQEYFRDAGLNNPVQRLRDGVETIDFLMNPGDPVPRKYVLLLDIKMPGLDGVEVLKKVKADERLKPMPVIMLTTTDDARDIAACYRAGCNGYLVKPVGPSGFAEMSRRLAMFLQVLKVTPV